MNMIQARPVRLLAGAAAAFLAMGAGAWAAPAAAHSGGAIIAVESADPVSDGVHYVIEITWEDDGHAAVGAAVTASAVGPDGESSEPVTMEPYMDEADGLYEGVLEMPEEGEWTVMFAALDPDGTFEHTEVVEADEGADEQDGAEDADELQDLDGVGGAGEGADVEPPPPTVFSPDSDPEALETTGAEDDSDDGPSIAVLIVAFGVLALIVAGVFLWVKQRGSGASASTPSDTDGGGKTKAQQAAMASTAPLPGDEEDRITENGGGGSAAAGDAGAESSGSDGGGGDGGGGGGGGD